jgi:hypothetical protein
MTKTLLDKLNTLDRIHNKIISQYAEKMNRVFQIVYEIDTEVEWSNVYKCYPTSNFGFIKGVCRVNKGDTMKNPMGETVILDSPMVLTVGFVLPLGHVDKLTPYEIAEYIQRMKMLEKVCDLEEFTDLLRSEDFDIDDIEPLLPVGIVREPPDEEDDDDIEELARPVEVDGFDTSSLTDEQLRSLITNTVVGTNGAKQKQ